MKPLITAEVTLPAPSEVVWHHLTSPQGLSSWLCDEMVIVPQVGGPFTPRGPHSPDPNSKEGEVLAVSPKVLLEVLWPIYGRPTHLRFALTDAGNTTHVSLAHRALEGWPAHLDPRQLWSIHLTLLRLVVQEGPVELPLRPLYGTDTSELFWLGISIGGHPRKVFQALTQRTAARHWLDPGARPGSGPGERHRLGLPNGRGPSRVECTKKNRLLIHDWHEPNQQTPSRVTWSLFPVAKKTQVELLHEGLDSVVEQRWLRLFWTGALLRLKDWVENGDCINV